MRVIDRNPIFLYLSVVSFYASSFSIAFMPAGFDDSGTAAGNLGNTLAAVFWLGIALGIVLTFVVRKKRLWDIKWNQEYKKSRKSAVPAFLRFFSNKPAAVFDTVFMLGLASLIVSNYYEFPESLLWILIFITVFSFEMHLVFNGVNYKWLKDS